MNEALRYRLYIARELLREGMESSQEPLPVSRMKALLLLDQAVELMLRTILTVVGSPKRVDNLPALLQQVVDCTPQLASHRPQLERIHLLRNQVQHDGVIPSSEDARTAADDVERFARALVQQTLKKTLEELTPIALVQDSEARDHLLKAEEHLRNALYEDACVETAIAFYGGSDRAIEKILPPLYRDTSREIAGKLFEEIGQAAVTASLSLHDHAFQQFAERFEDELRRRDWYARDIFEPFQRVLFLSGFGITPSELRRFEEVTPRVMFSVNGTPHVGSPPRRWPPTVEAAQYALDFSVRALLRLESWPKVDRS